MPLLNIMGCLQATCIELLKEVRGFLMFQMGGGRWFECLREI
jgi:hypothetical protein